MPKTRNISESVLPSATPSERDIAAWKDLPRDEQVKRFRQALADPACTEATGETMSGILAAARARAAGQDA